MRQNNSNDKNAMLAKIATINQVEGFDPTPFAMEYTDLNTGESRKRLPVMIQMAWFRMKYPEGRIAVQVSPGRDCFVATARVYPSYKDGPDCYLAEATAPVAWTLQNLLCPQESGRRQLLLVLRCVMRASGYSSIWPEKNMQNRRWMNFCLLRNKSPGRR